MSIGIWQIVLILVIVLLIFGAGKLPRVMGDFAKGIKSFKAGMKEGGEPPPNQPSNPASPSQPRVGEQPTASGTTTTAQKDETVQH